MLMTYKVQSVLVGEIPFQHPQFLAVPEITFSKVDQVDNTTWQVTSDEDTLNKLTNAGVTIVPEIPE